MIYEKLKILALHIFFQSSQMMQKIPHCVRENTYQMKKRFLCTAHKVQKEFLKAQEAKFNIESYAIWVKNFKSEDIHALWFITATVK